MITRLLFSFIFCIFSCGTVSGQGQPFHPGFEPPPEAIKNTIQGAYAKNVTLFFRNSPYRVTGDVLVEAGATLTIETGVRLYFDSGTGIKVQGSIWAVGNEWAHIQMLPYAKDLASYEAEMPDWRLIDGPTVRQGRLQVRFRDRWRSVCTMLSNWTSIDTGVACRSMGYSDGGFYKWYRRNNESYPFVLPEPRCQQRAMNLWQCDGLADVNQIRMSENLCQGEDDIGIYCWGPPTFSGWTRHWKGLQIYNAPFYYVNADPDMVAVQRESYSRLEFIDILYAGYDKMMKNATAALQIQGVAPLMNGLRIERSARDGIYLYESAGPVYITNSTIAYNRGHGIQVDNTTDGRVFINSTIIKGNYGDGVWYKQKTGTNLVTHRIHVHQKRQIAMEGVVYDEEPYRINMCEEHAVPPTSFFPHLILAYLPNGTLIEPNAPPLCWMSVALPARLPYTYSLQFMHISNPSPIRPPLIHETSLFLRVCDGTEDLQSCHLNRQRIPIVDAIFPQSISFKSSGKPMYLALDYDQPDGNSFYTPNELRVLFRIHSSVLDKAYYGLNITNSLIDDNIGNGVYVMDIRERTAFTNVTLNRNQGNAAFLVKDGAADIWLNDTRIEENWGDGMNVSYAGGSISINGTRIERNRWRGAAFHFNDSSPFFCLHQEIVFKGQPSNNQFYLPTRIVDNFWGGILVGNWCLHQQRDIQPKVLITWLEMTENKYHPALEIHSCQTPSMASTIVDITGNQIMSNTGMGIRIAPAVNMLGIINSNQFLSNNDTALLIRNADYPQLWGLPANITISKNSFKFNTAKYIVSLGLNEGSPWQKLIFNQQNEIRTNTVLNPFEYLNPRSTPYAAMVVSSSNVIIHRNCFKNERAKYEIAAELAEHAAIINATENNWGFAEAPRFLDRIFDNFNRFSLAQILVDPYMAVCNQRVPHITPLNEHFRHFRNESRPFEIGGSIYENHDLAKGKYYVTEDIHVVPGAKLTIAAGSTLQFSDGIGMLVQGELGRNEYGSADEEVVFTSTPFSLPPVGNARLVDEDGSDRVTEGRLEVLIEGQWGTVCNRSWTAYHARLTCNQMGLIMDPQYFENWRIFPSQGELPMLMDNIRCEENEVDITRCRHDGVKHNVGAGCRASEVVGLRCLEPRWAGVRYSLLANPPTVTGQSTMDNWLIEKAGLFDFRTPSFSPALQIDWNYHTFHRLTVRNNFWDGIDIVYNDLVKKPTLRDSRSSGNRRNGVHIRSAGITIEHVNLTWNGEAGIRYNPAVGAALQNDIVSWLDMTEQPELEANNIFNIPNHAITHLQVYESHLNQRKFLVAKETPDCPLILHEPCVYELDLEASGYEYGLEAKMAIQIVRPVSNVSDEDAQFFDIGGTKTFSARRDQIFFPFVSSKSRVRMRYTRSYGVPKLVVLVLFLDTQEYLDRFIHLLESVVSDNQYGISTMHHSNLSYTDGTLTNRWNNEKLWFQRSNFTGNTQAVLWMDSPQHEVMPGTPIATIFYHIDNCSIHHNMGAVIDTQRDLFASANVFRWWFWSNTIANNSGSTMVIRLPDTYNLLAKEEHEFKMTENRIHNNTEFRFLLEGFYGIVNISSNNITDNWASREFGLFEVAGMEKNLTVERNRFFHNWGHWLFKVNIFSHCLRHPYVPAFIQWNYIEFNHFIKPKEDYVDMYPRSYAVGIFGSQKVDVHFNRLLNTLMDFELVAGCKPITVYDSMNVTFNWWGTATDAEISQRIFDIDDWNIFTPAHYSPFFTSNEHFINFWWLLYPMGQLKNATYDEPTVFDLKGRMYQSKNMTLITERWYSFPYYYRPYRPYRIIRDVTIMPGATLYIEKGVEVHIWPNVRILVLGELVADGTYWQPIRFKPINVTEYDEIKNRVGTRYKRDTGEEDREVQLENGAKIVYRKKQAEDLNLQRKKRANRARPDYVYQEFPAMIRHDPYFQRFPVSLANQTQNGRAGWLQVYNATSGEIVPSCDRQFTIRNAQVVCRELGFQTMNAYHWITQRWDYNPKLRILKTYMEPRECRGDEERLDRCPLRLTGNTSQWQCMDNENFNYIFCGRNKSVDDIYIGNWGGITFAREHLELQDVNLIENSVLRNVEIVGGGLAHNESVSMAALHIFQRHPILDHVNVTNSSMHGIEIVAPRQTVVLNQVNSTDNNGAGIRITTLNLQAPNQEAEAPIKPLQIPYYAQGMLDMCASEKLIQIKNRILLYYKYDSRPIDCVKIFSAPGRKVVFRFLQVNLYYQPVDLGRSDALRIYNSISFLPSSMLAEFRIDRPSSWSRAVTGDILAIHLRATAADGTHGFIAEVAAMPSNTDSFPVEEVIIRNSRVDNNDRGGIEYQNVGETSPPLLIEDCSISYNGINLFGNISTTTHAVKLSLHNTMTLLFRGNSLTHNIGGLLLSARSSSPVARLSALIKDSLFSHNSNSSVIALFGNGLQAATLLNNVISLNYALFYDTIVARQFSLNMTRNVLFNNTGLHTVDMAGTSRLASTTHVLSYNFFDSNLALGHGHQYMEKYGYQPERTDEFDNRPRRKRQISPGVITQEGVSFDWWTHVDNETARYRATVLAGNAQGRYRGNSFNDPANDYELATSRQTQYEAGTIDAVLNYWGYPGTAGVAAGKIRDYSDFPYLIRVDYLPVLESNTSIIESDCPAGWLSIGHPEFKSCFLYVGAAATYRHAVQYCKELDAFVPYMRADDPRQGEIARRIEQLTMSQTTDMERINTFAMLDDIHVWIASMEIPSTQCGWLSTRTGKAGSVNCNALLPFVCEKGTEPYVEPVMWRMGIILAIVLGSVVVALLALLALLWCIKSRKRDEEVIERKNIIRASIKLQKKTSDRQRRIGNSHESTHASLTTTTINAYGENYGSRSTWAPVVSPTGTTHTSCSESFSTTDHTYAKYESLPQGKYNNKSSGFDESCTASTSYLDGKKWRSRSSEVYSEIRTFNTFDSPERKTQRTSDTSSCSTCPPSSSERTSTATDVSYSDCSTVQHSPPPSSISGSQPSASTSSQRYRPLPTRPAPIPPARTARPTSTYAPLSSTSIKPYPPGSGRSLVDLTTEGSSRKRANGEPPPFVETSM